MFLPKNRKLYEKIKEHLRIFEAEELIDKQVCNLSGGQLQRVLLALAVMDEPNLLLWMSRYPELTRMAWNFF